jgi:hypothetical protein
MLIADLVVCRKTKAADVPVVKEAIDCAKDRMAKTSDIQEQERIVAVVNREISAAAEIVVAVDFKEEQADTAVVVEDVAITEDVKEETAAKEAIPCVGSVLAFDANALLQEKLAVQIARLDQLNADLISNRLEPRSKRHISLAGKTYLAPLTTVGNLPFRRICKDFGVEVTCGEMAMTDNLCKGMNAEWSLTRRHPSEDIFGIQVCASDTTLAALAGHYINTYTPDVDFVDLNLGWCVLIL